MDGEGFIDLLNQLADEPTDSFSFEDRSWPPVTPWQWYKYLPLRIDYPWFMWQNGIQRDNNWLLEVQNSGRAYFIASEETHCPNDLKVLHGTKRFTVTETLLASICKVVRKASVSRGYAPGFPMDLTVALLVAVGTHKGTFENHSVGAMIPMRSICGDEDSLLQQAKASINEILRKTQFVQTMYVDIQDSFNSWPKSVATFVTKKMSENARIVLSIMITCATLKGKLQLAMTMDHAVMSRHEGVSLLRAIDDELLSYCKSRF
ncbi:unnamed protein product [Cyprideis torosa]|uniref:Uncharacterized protein n=1 Tax=Cyprideis torosa TaxID=163714 RepID=A0A7R8ZJQ6_9CRUS|nr:unnamed protein product [Cyprideis torosa]CAG0887684.1 unnamed protein product [Cyprideis torosa]